jgi:hypothetical protein
MVTSPPEPNPEETTGENGERDPKRAVIERTPAPPSGQQTPVRTAPTPRVAAVKTPPPAAAKTPPAAKTPARPDRTDILQ